MAHEAQVQADEQPHHQFVNDEHSAERVFFEKFGSSLFEENGEFEKTHEQHDWALEGWVAFKCYYDTSHQKSVLDVNVDVEAGLLVSYEVVLPESPKPLLVVFLPC